MGYPVQNNSAAFPLVFFMVQSADHLTGLTGASPTVTVSKNGAAFASPAGAVAEIGNGWYKVAGNATDTGTLGPIALHATAASGDPTDDRYDCVAYNPQSGTNLGLSALPTANPNASNGLATLGVGAGQFQTDGSGNIDANVVNWKGATAPAMTGDAFARLGAPVGASTSADIAQVEGHAASADSQSLAIQTATFIRTGTAQAGAASTITLDSGASATDNLYQDAAVVVTSGTGAGQVRTILSYVGSTKVATITPAWATNPDNTSVFYVLPKGQADIGAINGNSGGASRLDRSARAITLGTVGSGSTTTSIVTSSLSPSASANGQFVGSIVSFDKDTTTANLRGQKTSISASTSGGVLTVTALTDAPVASDTFTIT